MKKTQTQINAIKDSGVKCPLFWKVVNENGSPARSVCAANKKGDSYEQYPENLLPGRRNLHRGGHGVHKVPKPEWRNTGSPEGHRLPFQVR